MRARVYKDVQLGPYAALGRHVSKSDFRGADGLSRGRYVRAAERYVHVYAASHAHPRHGRARERDGKRTHTTPLTNPREPCRGISAAPPNGRHGTSPTPA